jgi:S-methylmethionine-dependent homocysteine/selenocysteine methylase
MHSFQLEVLKRAGVDFVSAMTFNNIAEAVVRPFRAQVMSYRRRDAPSA